MEMYLMACSSYFPASPQAFQRPNEMNNCGEYNDAVYMESQAFLMHEIMTDGMAFCSVM